MHGGSSPYLLSLCSTSGRSLLSAAKEVFEPESLPPAEAPAARNSWYELGRIVRCLSACGRLQPSSHADGLPFTGGCGSRLELCFSVASQESEELQRAVQLFLCLLSAKPVEKIFFRGHLLLVCLFSSI